MLDRYAITIIKSPVQRLASFFDRQGFSADQITIMGFLLGLLALPSIAFGHYYLGLLFIALNRTFDGIDGAVARIQGISDSGGFLDISLDFLFYSMVPFAFILADPQSNAVAGALLIFSFIGTGTSFLAFAVMASKQGIENPVYQHKSLYYIGGLTEGTETIICLALFCIFPNYFAIIAYLFASLCWLTTITRIWTGYYTLKNNSKANNHS